MLYRSQTRVVQKIDNAVHYPVDSVICFVIAYTLIVSYPLYSVMQSSNYPDQIDRV